MTKVYGQNYVIFEYCTLYYIQNTECLGPPSSTEGKEFIGTSTVLYAFKTWRLMKHRDIIHTLHKVSDTGTVPVLRNEGRVTLIQSDLTISYSLPPGPSWSTHISALSHEDGNMRFHKLCFFHTNEQNPEQNTFYNTRV
jgi:hypothetical protein